MEKIETNNLLLNHHNQSEISKVENLNVADENSNDENYNVTNTQKLAIKAVNLFKEYKTRKLLIFTDSSVVLNNVNINVTKGKMLNSFLNTLY